MPHGEGKKLPQLSSQEPALTAMGRTQDSVGGGIKSHSLRCSSRSQVSSLGAEDLLRKQSQQPGYPEVI